MLRTGVDVTVDASDSGDGITYERGSKPGRVRAVVMRHGYRITGKWRRTKEAATRALVVELVHQLRVHEEKVYDEEDGFYEPRPDTLRLTIAEGLEAMAGRLFSVSGTHAELFHVNGKEHIVMNIDRLYRGAYTLRWVHRRETETNG